MLVEYMAYGLKGVFHQGLKWSVQSCLHKNRGSRLNLDNVAGFSVPLLKAKNVIGNIDGPFATVHLCN